MPKKEIPQEDIQKNKDLAALSYVWVFSLIILLARRDSPFIQLHAKQGVILFFLSLVLWPLGVLRYGEFLVLALALLGFIQAAMGNTYRIPVIAHIADGTLRWYHVKKGWHNTKHAAIKIVKPDHITPEFREALEKQEGQMQEAKEAMQAEEKLLEREEKKLSALRNRIEEDEKMIHELEEEVENLEKKVDSLSSSR